MASEAAIARARERAKDYGRRREWEHITATRASAEELNQRLHTMYTGLADQIKAESSIWFMQYATSEGITIAEARRRVLAADVDELNRRYFDLVTGRRGKNYVITLTDKQEMALYETTMQVSRYELLMRQINFLALEVTDNVTQMIGEHLYNVTMEELVRQASILGETLRDISTLERIANRLVDTSMYGQTFSERIWVNHSNMVQQLASGVQRSIILGKNPLEWYTSLSGYVNEAVKNVEYACRRIAITEVGRVQVESQRDSYNHYGYKKYQVICEPTACEVCLPHDGEIYETREMTQGENSPMFHPNCQCRTAAYMDRQEVDDALDLFEVLVNLYDK